MTRFQTSILLLALFTTSCLNSGSRRNSSTTQYPLLTKQGPAGEELTYTLASHRSGVPRVTRSVQRQFKVANLGITGRSITRELADAHSLEAWQGVLVDRVNRKSAADGVGIARGDVLLSFAGTPLTSNDQLKDLVLQSPPDGPAVDISLLKVDGHGLYPNQALELSVTLSSLSASETKSDTTKLATDTGIFHLTGLQIGTLTRELSEEIYGTSEPVVLVADAMIGSPAYHAGFRVGDRILTCEGQPVQSHRDVSRAVLARAGQMNVLPQMFESSSSDSITPAAGPIVLTVNGPLGHHTADLRVREDLTGDSKFTIPILYQSRSSAQRTSWSFLDFIFQFGANYRSRYRRSASRAPIKDSFLSILPLGMFEFESTADFDRYCFFWFIEFTDRH